MSNAVLTKFHASLRTLEHIRNKMERLYNDDKIALRDLHSVYESLFLRSVTGFEAFLEALFIAILQRRVRHHPRVSLKMKASSDAALMEILLQGDKYLDWLPFNRTEERAKIYMLDGKPFSKLTDVDKMTIKTVTTIRHAIAHASKHAVREFEQKVIGGQNVLRGEKKPAGFLRSQFRGNPGQTRFQLYVAELGRIARDLS
jgi:hypothetical protein